MGSTPVCIGGFRAAHEDRDEFVGLGNNCWDLSAIATPLTLRSRAPANSCSSNQFPLQSPRQKPNPPPLLPGFLPRVLFLRLLCLRNLALQHPFRRLPALQFWVDATCMIRVHANVQKSPPLGPLIAPLEPRHQPSPGQDSG